jgi:hypothetical protein
MSEVDYNKLRLDVLIKLADERNIECKPKKDEIIKYLKLDDEGKYIKETTYTKDGNGYIIGIDISNKNHMMQMGALILKKEARTLNRYCDNRVQYWAQQKLV